MAWRLSGVAPLSLMLLACSSSDGGAEVAGGASGADGAAGGGGAAAGGGQAGSGGSSTGGAAGSSTGGAAGSSTGGAAGSSTGGAAGSGTGGGAGAADGCRSVRLTSYTAAAGGWCEFDRTLALLPSFVRDGLTLAIAEPYNGGSFGGTTGEACGQCWEIDTITDTRVVMVHDLCPVEGNPLCAGGHFHFDLSTESAAALHGGGLDEGSARPVPCPVEGNVSLQINDRNEWGYVRFAVINHRIPVRTVEYRAAGGSSWLAAERSGGAWQLNDGEVFASGKSGGVFRLTSAQGESVESATALTYDVAKGSTFDLGVQLTDQASGSGETCVFTPPGDVYVDGWGGIDEVRWVTYPWGSAAISEVTDGCRSGSCLGIPAFSPGSGVHLAYRQAFPTSTFSKLSIWLRSTSSSAELVVAPSSDGARCAETVVSVGPDWTETSIDVGAACTGLTTLNAVTLDPRGALDLLIDDVQLSP